MRGNEPEPMDGYCTVASDGRHSVIVVSTKRGDRVECEDCAHPLLNRRGLLIEPKDLEQVNHAKVYQTILGVLSTHNPLRLKNAELLEMRRQVISLVCGALGTELDDPIIHEPGVVPTTVAEFTQIDPSTVLAIQLVAGYKGENAFMTSLRKALDVYGSLTVAQMNAVLAPPNQRDIEEMAAFGVVKESVTYHWQALDALRVARKRIRESAIDG